MPACCAIRFFLCIVWLSAKGKKREVGMPLNLDGAEASLVNGEQQMNKVPHAVNEE